jgi:hypothetical protein
MKNDSQNNIILKDKIKKKKLKEEEEEDGLVKAELKKKTQNIILMNSILWVWL